MYNFLVCTFVCFRNKHFRFFYFSFVFIINISVSFFFPPFTFLFSFLQVWDYKTENVRLKLEVPSAGSFANCCIFADDSSVILFGGDDKVVYAYDNDTGCSVSRFETSDRIIAILSITGKYVLGILCLWFCAS